MTKKSYARQRKDQIKASMIDAGKTKEEYFQDNTAWDDAEQVYQEAAKMLVGTGEAIMKGFSDKDIYSYFKFNEKVDVNTALNGMQNDLVKFAENLSTIHDLHKGKTGGVSTDDDFMQVVNIVDQYATFTANFSAVVSPNRKFLLNKLTAACERREKAENEQKDAVDADQTQVQHSQDDVEQKDVNVESQVPVNEVQVVKEEQDVKDDKNNTECKVHGNE